MSKRINEFITECETTKNYTNLIIFYIEKLYLFNESKKREDWREQISQYGEMMVENRIQSPILEQWNKNKSNIDRIKNLVVASEFDDKIKKNYNKYVYFINVLCEKFFTWLDTKKRSKEDIINRLYYQGL